MIIVPIIVGIITVLVFTVLSCNTVNKSYRDQENWEPTLAKVTDSVIDSTKIFNPGCKVKYSLRQPDGSYKFIDKWSKRNSMIRTTDMSETVWIHKKTGEVWDVEKLHSHCQGKNESAITYIIRSTSLAFGLGTVVAVIVMLFISSCLNITNYLPIVLISLIGAGVTLIGSVFSYNNYQHSEKSITKTGKIIKTEAVKINQITAKGKNIFETAVVIPTVKVEDKEYKLIPSGKFYFMNNNFKNEVEYEVGKELKILIPDSNTESITTPVIGAEVVCGTLCAGYQLILAVCFMII